MIELVKKIRVRLEQLITAAKCLKAARKNLEMSEQIVKSRESLAHVCPWKIKTRWGRPRWMVSEPGREWLEGKLNTCKWNLIKKRKHFGKCVHKLADRSRVYMPGPLIQFWGKTKVYPQSSGGGNKRLIIRLLSPPDQVLASTRITVVEWLEYKTNFWKTWI